MNAVQLDHVSKWFDRREGAPLHVLDAIDIAIPQHAIVALLGASGCGKSTLLNMIAGLIEPDEGAVLLDGIPSHAFRDWRAMTYMFQEDRLLPWRTAAQNVAFGLEAGGMGREERRRRVDETLGLVGLDGFRDAYPHELSGACAAAWPWRAASSPNPGSSSSTSPSRSSTRRSARRCTANCCASPPCGR